MRATFITLAAEGGAPLDRIQRAAGHPDPRTTRRYVRRSDDLDTIPPTTSILDTASFLLGRARSVVRFRHRLLCYG
jgi:integrase